MQDKPRIMLVGPWPPTTGGSTTFMLNVAKSRLAERYDFIAYTTSRPVKNKAAASYGYGAMLSGGISRLLAAILVTVWHVVKFPFALAAMKPDIVQVQASDFQAFWEAIIYVYFCKLIRRPVVLRLGGAFDHFYRASGPRAKKMIARALLWPGLLIVQSEYWRTFVTEIARNPYVLVLPNAVSDSLIDAPVAAGNSPPVFLFSAGTEADRKGIVDVIAAMRLLKERGTAVRFRLLAMLPHSQEQVRSAGVSGMADIEGYVDHARMMEAMRSSDVFLLPSRGEGFPNALVEAMACGLAAIVTPVGAIPEIMGRDGAITVPVGDSLSLADAIGRLADDPSERENLGKRARQIVAGRYTASRVWPMLDSAWQALLERSRGRSGL